MEEGYRYELFHPSKPGEGAIGGARREDIPEKLCPDIDWFKTAWVHVSIELQLSSEVQM